MIYEIGGSSEVKYPGVQPCEMKVPDAASAENNGILEGCLTSRALGALAERNRKLKVSLIAEGIEPQGVCERSVTDGKKWVCQKSETAKK